MTLTEMTQLVRDCTYKPGWSIWLHLEGDRPYLQLGVSSISDASLDSAKRDGTRTPWRSGKRYLSLHMCRQEVVGAVFALIRDAEEHEAREWFRYRDRSIFNPHLDPDALADLAGKAVSFNVRENAMSMVETP